MGTSQERTPPRCHPRPGVTPRGALNRSLTCRTQSRDRREQGSPGPPTPRSRVRPALGPLSHPTSPSLWLHSTRRDSEYFPQSLSSQLTAARTPETFWPLGLRGLPAPCAFSLSLHRSVWRSSNFAFRGIIADPFKVCSKGTHTRRDLVSPRGGGPGLATWVAGFQPRS